MVHVEFGKMHRGGFTILFKNEYPTKHEVKYRSLTKKGPWAEHLTSLPKRGWALF